MEFNKKNIKKLKGVRVRIKYTKDSAPQNITGIILNSFTNFIVFEINRNNEIPINYSNIDHIETVKKFSSYINKAESLFKSEQYQKAHDVVFQLKEYEMFKLPGQLKIIDDFIQKCKGELFKLSRK